MSRTTLKPEATNEIDPSFDTGDAWYQEKLKQKEKDAAVINDMERNFYKTASASDRTNSRKLRDKESEGVVAEQKPKLLDRSSKSKKARKAIFKGLFKGKTSLAAILVTLVGGGGALTLLMTPAIGLVQMKELFTDDLNTQVHAVSERSATLLRSKLKTATSGACGVITIKCKFATMSDKQVEKFKQAGFEVERDMTKGFGSKRGQVTKIVHTATGTTMTTAQQFSNEMRNNIPLMADSQKAYNPKFNSLKDPIAQEVFRNLKITKAQKITGDTDEDRKKSLANAVSGQESPTTKNLTPIKDDKGNDTGEFRDDEGGRFTADEAAAAQSSGDRIANYATTGGSKAVVKAAITGVGIIGTVDTTCTIYNTSRLVAALSKVKKKAQAARFAMAMLLTPADSIKAGEATEGLIEFIGNNTTQVDTNEKAVDESKWSTAGSASNPPMAANPDYGKNGFDAPSYAAVAHGDAPVLNLRAQRFMVGGGLSGTLDSINRAIAFIVNGGNPDPRQVGAKCKLVQNPAVRLGSLAVGVIAGVGTLGLSTAVSVGGSVALALALPYLESTLADIVTGNMFKDLEGLDTTDADFVGTAGITGDIAMNRGMKPQNATEAVQYAQQNAQTNQQIAKVEQYMARTTPFDIYNQYSFLGSLTRSITPYIRQSSTSVGMMAMNVTNLVPAALNSFTPSTKALSAERFKKCNDPLYKQIGIDADIFCNVRYGLSEEELAMDPVENADWMMNSGNVTKNDETGEPIDNGNSWNYVKFLKECTDRTAGWGEDQEENAGSGANCLAADKEADNKHYRIYTMDKGIDADMDGEPASEAAPGTTGFTTGESGTVSATGWAFPTVQEAVVTSGYKSPSRPDHRGVDLALRSSDINGAMGKPIFAARDGKVIAAGPAQGFGNWIIIQHTIDGKQVDTVYGHMYNDGVLVKQGDTVKAGQQIGKIGSNGQSTGAHLHFEVWNGGRFNGTEVDPTPIIEAARSSTPAEKRV